MSDGSFLINSFKIIYSELKERFVFLIDEWDVIFREEYNTKLCNEYNVDYTKIKYWYDGYRLDGLTLYNPIDITKSIRHCKFQEYWNNTGTRNAIIKCLKLNDLGLDVVYDLITHKSLSVDVNAFRNISTNNRNQALTILIHLGYLTYDEATKSYHVPNYEILNDFERVIKVWNYTEID